MCKSIKLLLLLCVIINSYVTVAYATSSKWKTVKATGLGSGLVPIPLSGVGPSKPTLPQADPLLLAKQRLAAKKALQKSLKVKSIPPVTLTAVNILTTPLPAQSVVVVDPQKKKYSASTLILKKKTQGTSGKGTLKLGQVPSTSKVVIPSTSNSVVIDPPMDTKAVTKVEPILPEVEQVSTGLQEDTHHVLSPKLTKHIHKWTQGKKTDAEFIAAIRRDDPNSSLLKTIEETDQGDGRLLEHLGIEVDDSLPLVVRGKRTGWEAAKLATNNGIDLSDRLASPDLIDHSTEDAAVVGMSREDKKTLFAATMQKIHEQNPETAEQVANGRSLSGTKELNMYDELPVIVNDGNNFRIHQGVMQLTDVSGGVLDVADSESATESGISAGDKNALSWFKGVWVRGLYGDINQGQHSGQTGFHGKTKGGTIGIDGNLTDNTIIGLSYTRMLANFKYKQGQGNKVDTTSDFVSLYGISNLNNNFVLHGLFSVGKTKAKQQTQHLVGTNTFRMATGKSTVTTYSVESILNYKLPMNNPEFYVMPNIGFRYSKNFDGGYSEYGTGIYNLTVSSKQHTSWAIITGIKMGKAHRVSDHLIITPGLHAEIDHYVYNKTSQAKTKMEWSDTFIDGTTIAIKTEKTGYNLGASLLAGYKSSEILAAYNAHLRGKYTSHQGSLKFRFLF